MLPLTSATIVFEPSTFFYTSPYRIREGIIRRLPHFEFWFTYPYFFRYRSARSERVLRLNILLGLRFVKTAQWISILLHRRMIHVFIQHRSSNIILIIIIIPDNTSYDSLLLLVEVSVDATVVTIQIQEGILLPTKSSLLSPTYNALMFTYR